MKNVKKYLLILTLFSLTSAYANKDSTSASHAMIYPVFDSIEDCCSNINSSECVAQLDVQSLIINNDPQAKALFIGLQKRKVKLQTFVAYFIMKGRRVIEPILNRFEIEQIPVFVLKSKNKFIALITAKILQALSQYEVTVLEKWSDLGALLLSRTDLLNIKAHPLEEGKYIIEQFRFKF